MQVYRGFVSCCLAEFVNQAFNFVEQLLSSANTEGRNKNGATIGQLVAGTRYACHRSVVFYVKNSPLPLIVNIQLWPISN